MSKLSDLAFLIKRQRDERVAMAQAENPVAKAAHKQLADAYQIRIAAIESQSTIKAAA